MTNELLAGGMVAPTSQVIEPGAVDNPVVTADVGSVAEVVRGANNVLVTTHRGPDGDGVGSAIAVAALLEAAGKKATLYCPDLVPRRLKWLPRTKWAQALKKTAKFDLCIVVDCPDRKLLGDAFPVAEVTGPVLALDHHASAHPFGTWFVCDTQAASTGVVIERLARELDWPLTAEIATALYVGLVSDTGGFRHANTDVKALEVAARLVAAGAEPSLIADRLEERGTLGRAKLLAAALSSMEITEDGLVATMRVTSEMVKASGASWEDTGSFIHHVRSLRGVEIAVLFTTGKFGGTRASMRARGPRFDVGSICAALGGGGHRGAAACTIKDEFEPAIVTAMNAIRVEIAAVAAARAAKRK